MISLCTSLTTTELWTIIAAIGAISAAGGTIWYTVITHKLWKATEAGLQTTKNSLDATLKSLTLTQDGLDLNKKSLEHANKLAGYEIYMKIVEKVDSDKSQEIFEICTNKNLEIKDRPVKSTLNEEEVTITGAEIRTHLLLPLSDLANF